MISKTWVQVPGLAKFNIIFHFQVPCNANIGTHHTHSECIVHASPGDLIKGSAWKYTMRTSQQACIWLEKSTNCQQMGQAFQACTSQIWAIPHPGLPTLIIFFYLFIYYFNCYVLLFYLIFNQNIKNIQKSEKNKKYNFYFIISINKLKCKSFSLIKF